MPAPTSAIARLKDADADGLDASDYKTPTFAGLGPDALAEADLKLTQTVLTYARHLQAGRFPYTRVSHNIELPQARARPADVLAKIADAADAGKALDEFSPQHEAYKKLKADARRDARQDRRRAQRDRRRAAAQAQPAKRRWKTRACRCCATSSASPAKRPI